MIVLNIVYQTEKIYKCFLNKPKTKKIRIMLKEIEQCNNQKI